MTSKLARAFPKFQPAFQDGDVESDDSPLIPDASDVESTDGDGKDRCRGPVAFAYYGCMDLCGQLSNINFMHHGHEHCLNYFMKSMLLIFAFAWCGTIS